MPWFKIDDTLAHHVKVMSAGNAAMGLWVRAGSYCAQQLTDGVVPNHVLVTLGTRAQARRLVAAGLWEQTPDGFRFHDWCDYQPTRAEVIAQRERERDKKRQWRERAGRSTDGQFVSPGDTPRDTPGDSPVDTPGDDTGDSHGESTRTRPDPTRPDPTHSGVGGVNGARRRRSTSTATPLDKDWTPTPEHAQLAAEAGINLDRSAFRFRNHHTARSTTRADWDAEFTNWLDSDKDRTAPATTDPYAHIPWQGEEPQT